MCLFCKIINNQISSFKLYEDAYVLCFLDISAISEGHTLIVPKKHFNNIFDCDEITIMHIAKSIKIITNLLREKLNITNCNILNNSGKYAGQTVSHLHFHIIPRHQDDMLDLTFPEKEPNFDRLQLTYAKLLEK